MTLNTAAMTALANKLRTEMLLYGQLHSDAAGSNGTANVATATREAASWTSATGLGNFGLASPMVFTGGTPGSSVVSITFWTAASNGTYYGEFLLGQGSDTKFNPTGGFSVTAVDFAGGTAEGS